MSKLDANLYVAGDEDLRVVRELESANRCMGHEGSAGIDSGVVLLPGPHQLVVPGTSPNITF